MFLCNFWVPLFAFLFVSLAFFHILKEVCCSFELRWGRVRGYDSNVGIRDSVGLISNLFLATTALFLCTYMKFGLFLLDPGGSRVLRRLGITNV